MTGEGSESDQSDQTNRSAIERRAYLAGMSGVGLAAGLSSQLLTQRPSRDSGTGNENIDTQATDTTEILVGVQSTPDIAGTIARHLPSEARVVHQNEKLGFATVELPNASSASAKQAVIDSLTKKQGIRYAEPNERLSLQYSPSDSLFSRQFAAKEVNADDAWDVTKGDSSVKIAFLDQGIKYDHPDLSANMDGSVTNHGKDFVDDDGDPYPDDLTKEHHGTHVAGIAAAEIDNSEGVAGICQASILSGRVANENHEATRANLADGISWATNQGADVINISLGGDTESQALKDAVDYAYQNDVLLVAAAGNDSGGAVDYPAAYNEVVAVSAINYDGNIAGFSSIGSEVELCAPGVTVLSTTTTDGYAPYSGTSMAAPVVSGVAALAKSKWSLSNEELRSHLQRTAVDLGLSSHKQGMGRVDAYEAVTTPPGAELLEDFEDGDISEYDGNTSEYTVEQSSAMEGSYRLKSTEPFCQIARDRGTPRGHAYKCRLQAGSGSGSKPGLLVSVQDQAHPMDDCYWLSLNVPGDELSLLRIVNEDVSFLDSVGVSISEGTEYRGEIQLREETIKGVLYDADGTKLTETAAVTDTTFSGGCFGFYTGGSSAYPAYFDYVTKRALGPSGVIDDFEDGDLSEYSFLSGSSGTSVVSGPAYNGTRALEVSGTDAELTSTSGLDLYPSAGNTFSYWIRGANSPGDINLGYGVQDHANCYFATAEISNDAIALSRREADSVTELARTSVNLVEDTWYQVEVDWGSGSTHTITLYDTAGTQLAQITGSDSTWSGGGIGYDAYMSGGGTAYVDAVVMAAGYAELDGVPPVVDDFEDGDLSEYTGVDSTDWGAVSGNAFEGTYAATAPSNSGIIYNNGSTFERGGTLETRAYLGTTNGVASGIEFWFFTNADASEKYVQYVSAENGKHFLSYRNGDDREILDYNNDLSIPSNEWLRLKITTDSSTIRAELYDSDGNLVSRLAGADSQLSSGGYGFQDEWQTQNSPVYVDQVRGD